MVVGVVTLAGSPAPRSTAAALLEHSKTILERHALVVKSMSVRDIPPEELIGQAQFSPAVRYYSQLIRQAGALIVATPVYKDTYAELLRAWLNLLPAGILRNTLVLPIITGSSARTEAQIYADLAVRFRQLGAKHIIPSLFAAEQQIQLLGSKLPPRIHRSLEERLGLALDDIAQQLGVLPLAAVA